MMFRRRQRNDAPQASRAVALGNDNDNPKNSTVYERMTQVCSFKNRFGICISISRHRVMLIILNVVLIILILLRYTSLARIVSETVEGAVKDPYRRAKVFNPLRTFHAMYIDQNRPQDRDKDRLDVFRNRNPSFIQRFPAHHWTNEKLATSTTADREKEKLLDVDGQDYVFIFEDDIRITEPLRSKLVLQAPDVADIVFLMPSAMKRVMVPWKEMNDDHKTWNISKRVIGGFGTFGYLITRLGAEKMMKFLTTCREPIDLAFFGSTSVQVYIPERWPLVRHDPNPNAESSRLEINQQQGGK
eukprot:scaffold4905_cov98-Cylindrotheca_fusiformis.AAC.3